MTQSIPSGFSRKDLEDLYAAAPLEEQSTDTLTDAPLYGSQELTQDELMEAAVKLVDDSMDICGDPVFHKAIIAIVIGKMIEWHKEVSWKQESPESTGAWQRDAGKFQAMMDILTSLTVSNDDFIIS
jgi:hypothetical protein